MGYSLIRGWIDFRKESEFSKSYDAAKNEAKMSFNDDSVYLEKYFLTKLIN